MRNTYLTLVAGRSWHVCQIPCGQPGQIIRNTGHSVVYVDSNPQVDETGVALAPGDYFTFPGDANTPVDIWARSVGGGEITVVVPE